MAAKKHLFKSNQTKHKKVSSTTEGGACLTGHSASYTDFKGGSTCNYRYQSYEHAKSNGEIKGYLHGYNDGIDSIRARYDSVKTSAYETKSGNYSPARYCADLKVPEKGDWDVGGPSKDIKRSKFSGVGVTIKQGHNFTRDTWPYWNQAHHLIPKGTFKSEILESGVGEMIEAALLKAEYNINYKRNMLFLPMDKEVGEILDMPRHIQLKDGDDDEIKSLCTSHPVYDEYVRKVDDGLSSIIADYADMAVNADQEDCEEPDLELDKEKLGTLSDTLLKLLLGSEGGRSLDSISNKKLAN